MMSDNAAREDASREYQSSLEDLTFNSKPHINMLTILAEENLQFTRDIVAIIEAQIAKAPRAEKLPVLYLVDSIVKNVGGQYLEVFAQNLVTSFICVFEKVDENTRKSLFKLRSTWDDIFPLKKLYALDVRVNSIDPAWPIKPLPPNVNASIHVNPKFLKPTEEMKLVGVTAPQPQVHSIRSPISPKRKDRQSPKRRPTSINPHSNSGKVRQLNKHQHNETSVQQANVREDRSTPKKNVSEQRRLKRPLEDRPNEHRDTKIQRMSPSEHKGPKDVKRWRSGWDENIPHKSLEPDSPLGKPGPQRHKTWSSNQRPSTPRTPKQHRLSVDANLPIPEVLNSANKRDLLRKVCLPFDSRGQNRFERPPLLKAPVRYDNPPMPHGPVRYEEPLGVGRFNGPRPNQFEGPMRHQRPGRFDNPEQMRFDNPVQSNRFDGPTRFENPHMMPGPHRGFDGPTRYPSGPVNFDGPRRLEGPGNQPGMMRFETPVQPGPMNFDGQPPVMLRCETPQVPPRYPGPPNIQYPLRPQGQPGFDQPQTQGPVLDPGVLQPNFGMAPPNAFVGQPQPFQVQHPAHIQQPTNFNVPSSTPSGFQNSYRPVAPFPGVPTNAPQSMGIMPAAAQTFIQPNPVPFNPSNSQFVQPDSHLGQMDVNDLLSKLISSGIIKPAQSETSSETTSAPQSQNVPEEKKQEEDDNLRDLTGFALEDMKQRYECVITELYTGIQCYFCGMRFTASPTDVYADHLDWHYRQNRSKKESSKKVTHRQWYYSVTDWIEFEEIADLEERAKSLFFEKVHEEVVQKTQEAAKEREFQSVKAAPDVVDESCEICQDQLEMYWKEEEEEWHLKNAMRVDGKIYHPSCYEDYKNVV